MGRRKDIEQTFKLKQLNVPIGTPAITSEDVARAISLYLPQQSIQAGLATDEYHAEQEIEGLKRALTHARTQKHGMVSELIDLVQSAENAVHLGMMLQRFFEDHGQK